MRLQHDWAVLNTGHEALLWEQEMKKVLNDPSSYVDEMLEGLCLAYPSYYRRIGPEGRVIARTAGSVKGKIGIVSGGGSGHLPVFTGFVGKGLLDACAVGEVFSSPSVDQMVDAIRAANGGVGVLRLYGNYGGDTMNFDMAGEILEAEGIPTSTVRVADDVASAKLEERSKRRGVAGLVYVYKIAGAMAETLADLHQVTSIARKAADAIRSVGVALTPCTIPSVGHPTFQISEDEMEIGMGIHGEPGVRRGPLKNADSITDEMMAYLLADIPLKAGDRISVLVNSLGATPLEELLIVYRKVVNRADDLGVEIIMPLIGRYATSMEMTGFSITLFKLDDELERLLKAPCDCPFLRI
jgi:phosphoenolpyruvate---glycerone phosphotransferase subunit DhaK